MSWLQVFLGSQSACVPQNPGVRQIALHWLLGVKTQPVAGLQVSSVQTLLSLQTMGVKTHPVAGLQVSAVQALLSLQTMGVKTHPEAGLQVSEVQALLSSHTMGVCSHSAVAALQRSVVHALLSS